MTEDVRPLCIFCHQRFTYATTEPGPDFIERRCSTEPCPDERTSWGHVELWRSTKEQRDARFGPYAVKPTQAEHAASVAALTGKPVSKEPEPAPQMGFAI
jgi:hypothetical protein